jgi:hypothetical protein
MRGILKNLQPVGWFVKYSEFVEPGIDEMRELPLHPKSTEGWSITEHDDFFEKFSSKTIEYENTGKNRRRVG